MSTRRIGAGQVKAGDVIVVNRDHYQVTEIEPEPDDHVSIWGFGLDDGRTLLLFESYPPDAPIWRVEEAQ